MLFCISSYRTLLHAKWLVNSVDKLIIFIADEFDFQDKAG